MENTERHKENKSAKITDPKSHHKKEKVTIVTVAGTMVAFPLQFIKFPTYTCTPYLYTMLSVNYIIIKPGKKVKLTWKFTTEI